MSTQAMRRAVATMRDDLARLGARAALGWRSRLAERRFPKSAEKWLDGFMTGTPPTRDDYAALFRYFISGFMVRRSRLGAHADYAGMGSYNGPAMDRLEGFSRIAPLAAAWLHGGRPRQMAMSDGATVDLVDMLRAGIHAGTHPASPEYWGDIRHWSQAIVEAADIALSLWLTREQLWEGLPDGDRERIGRWLIQVNGKRIPDNNWHLFVAQVNAVLAALGMPHDAEALARHYQRSKAFYRGQGWFRDGEREDEPGYDYYNAWGFHYHLQWLRRIDPALDAAFIDQAGREFVAVYRHFIGPAGLPMLGRSACYRMAAPVPLILAQHAGDRPIPPGEARRSLDVVWSYFIRHGAVRQGTVTQGYLATDARLLEDYSGPASCLWSLRSLVAAFAVPDRDAFWQAEPAPLPVEKGDYRLPVGPTGWTVVGDHATGSVAIETGATASPSLEGSARADRLLDPFRRKPRRPKNIQAKYYRRRYDSTSPYGLGELSDP
jgi:hypothetical protein